MNLAFAKIPIGGHTVCACVAASAVNVSISILLRSSIDTIVPFESMYIGILGMILGDTLFGMIKFIPVKDKRMGQTKRWAIGNDHSFIFSISCKFDTKYTHTHTHTNTYNQGLGFTCPHHIDSISKQELL